MSVQKQSQRKKPLRAMTKTEAAQYAIGWTIRRARARRGMRQQDLADAAGMSLHHLSNIERGLSDVTTGMLSKIAAALDVPLDFLLEPIDRPDRPGLRYWEFVNGVEGGLLMSLGLLRIRDVLARFREQQLSEALRDQIADLDKAVDVLILRIGDTEFPIAGVRADILADLSDIATRYRDTRNALRKTRTRRT